MDSPDAHAPEHADSPVDMVWLRECSDDDPETMRTLVELFLTRTDVMIGELDGALAANSAADVRRIAHACVGSSGTCGMVTLAPLFKDLEKMGAENNLSDAPQRASQIKQEFERVKAYLSTTELG